MKNAKRFTTTMLRSIRLFVQAMADGVNDIRDHFGRTMLQLVGIILGAGSIVATFALAASGKEASKKFYAASGGIQKIWIGSKAVTKVDRDAKLSSSKGLTYNDSLVIARTAKEIDLVSPVASANMTVRYRTIEKSRGVMGVAPAYSPMNEYKIADGRFLSDGDVSQASRVVVLGSERAVEFFGTNKAVGKTMTMNDTGYLVVGVMQEKYFSFDGKRNALRWMNRQLFIPITTLLTRRGESLKSGRISWMHARMRDVKKHEEAVLQIEKILMREHGVRDFEAISRVANMKRNAEQDKMYDMIFMVCGVISLIVGGIVVMNIQLASFNERIREVGIRKAIGASGFQIFAQFITESVLVSTLGGIIGVFVGKLFTLGISALTKNPGIITPQVIIMGLVFASGTGLIFGIYPAIKASRLNPIEALRTE